MELIESYISGVSITYSSNPRQHIWTYASGKGEKISDKFSCPCSSNVARSPSYVGSNYYCESATWYLSSRSIYYFNETLWDGEGCIDHCCDDTTQPWFYRQQDLTIQDHIEVRICTANRFGRGSTLIDQLELYIQ